MIMVILIENNITLERNELLEIIVVKNFIFKPGGSRANRIVNEMSEINKIKFLQDLKVCQIMLLFISKFVKLY